MNIQRFRQVLAYIEEFPWEWNQGNPHSCPGCFLYHASRLAGANHGHDFTTQLGCEFLGIRHAGAEWQWLFGTMRTLDDFRTIARRPFA